MDRASWMQADNYDLTDEIRDDISSRRSAVESQLQEHNHPQTSATVVAKKLPIAFMKSEENSSSKLKPKKPLTPVEHQFQRKPLKTLNPLQNKEKFGCGVRKISPTQKSHPILPRKQGTPVNINFQIPSGSKPVASSTPALSSHRRYSLSSKQESTDKKYQQTNPDFHF